MLSRWTAPKLIAVVVLVAAGAVAAALVFTPAMAQEGDAPRAPVVEDEEGDARRDPGARREEMRERFERLRDRGGMGPEAMARLRIMQAEAAAPPAIAVAGDAVFVVKGNTLYKFSADDLSLIAKAELEEEPPPILERFRGRGARERVPE